MPGPQSERGGMAAFCICNASRFVGALKIFDQNFMNPAQRGLLPSHPASISSWALAAARRGQGNMAILPHFGPVWRAITLAYDRAYYLAYSQAYLGGRGDCLAGVAGRLKMNSRRCLRAPGRSLVAEISAIDQFLAIGANADPIGLVPEQSLA
jgi:hypothetical protein